MVLDTERRVREALHITFLSLIRKTKKLLAPHLQTILPPWIVSLQDPCREVAAAADAAMTEAFPSKRIEAFQFCKKETLNYLISNSQQTIQSLADDHSTPQEVQQDRYERVVGTAYTSAAFLLNQLPAEQVAQVGDLFEQLFGTDFWKMFNNSKIPVGIRRCVYQSSQTVIAKLPDVMSAHLVEITDAVMGALGETDPISQAAVWGVVLALTKSFPQAWTSTKKHTFQKLFAALRAGLRGGGAAAYQYVLPLIAFIPTEALGKGTEFHKQFFESMWKPVGNKGSSGFENALLETFTDCALLFINRAVEREDSQAFVGEVLTLSATRMLQFYVTVDTVSDGLIQLPHKLASVLAQISTKHGNELLVQWWTSVVAICKAGRSDRVATVLAACHGLRADLVTMPPVVSFVSDVAATALGAVRNKERLQLDFLNTAIDIFGVEVLASGGAVALWNDIILPALQTFVQSGHVATAEDQAFFQQLTTLSRNVLLATDSVTKLWQPFLDSLPPSQAMLHVRHMCTVQRARFRCASIERLVAAAIQEEPWSESSAAFLQFCVTGDLLISEDLLHTLISHVAANASKADKEAPQSTAVSMDATQQHYALVLSSIAQNATAVASAADTVFRTLLAMTLSGRVSTATWKQINISNELRSLLLRETIAFVHKRLSSADASLSIEWWSRLATTAHALVTTLAFDSDSRISAIRLLLLDQSVWQNAIDIVCQTEPQLLDMVLPTDSVLIAGTGSTAANYANILRQQVRLDVPLALFAFVTNLLSLLGLQTICRDTQQWKLPLADEVQLIYYANLVFAVNANTSFRSSATDTRADYAVVCEMSNQLYNGPLGEIADLAPLQKSLLENAVAQGDKANVVTLATLNAVLKYQNDAAVAEYARSSLINFDRALQSLPSARVCALLCRQFVAGDSSTRIQEQCLSCWNPAQAEAWLTIASVLFRPEATVASALIPRLNEIMVATNGVRKCAALAAYLHCCFVHCSEAWSQRDWQYVISRITEAVMQCVVDTERNAHLCIHILAIVARMSVIATTKPKIDASATIDETTAIVNRTRSLQQAMEKINPLLQRWLRHCADLHGPLDMFTEAVLEQLSRAVSVIPQHQIQDVALLFRLLRCPYLSLQRAAYSLLVLHAKSHQHDPQEDKAAEGAAVVIPQELRDLMINVPTDEGSALIAYLFGWLVFFAFFDDESGYQRLDLTMFVRGANSLPGLLQTITELLPLERGVSVVDEQSVRNLNAFAVTEQQLVPLCTHVLYCALKRLPALSRQWETECNRHTALQLEKFIAKHISPLLIAEELDRLVNAPTVENLTCSVSKTVREARVRLELTDLVMELVIRLPQAFPIRPVEVEQAGSAGVSETEWRRWLLSMTATLVQQNGNIYDAVLVWKRNVDKRFEGVEECPICYSVVHLNDKTLPKMQCKTCKKKFHGACLFKWFNTSHQSTCPMCRSPW